MPSFQTLLNNFPSSHSEVKARCFNRQKNRPDEPFDDYCAIMLSECFIRSGLSLRNSTAAKCWSHAGEKHILRAEQFAGWLSQSPPAGFGKREQIAPASFTMALAKRTGVVFFKDYWRRGSESDANRSGDHIDLWDRSRITSSSMMWRSVLEFFGPITGVSELGRSRQIWFWDVKG